MAGQVDDAALLRRRLRHYLLSRRRRFPAPGGRSQYQAGLAYLRAELPFLLATSQVLDVPSAVVCYHTVVPVLRELYNPCLPPPGPGGTSRSVLSPKQGSWPGRAVAVGCGSLRRARLNSAGAAHCRSVCTEPRRKAAPHSGGRTG
ncbi:tRNA-dependent cyclodipeptide synthase [Streptomyces sp. CA-250714]|uniref:tRNA-dependent cyclodipeptide synthase n=1 Tax=Streptomyces sp. CA-250714 TaxID=3240060 RepID=UPI003D94DB38